MSKRSATVASTDNCPSELASERAVIVLTFEDAVESLRLQLSRAHEERKQLLEQKIEYEEGLYKDPIIVNEMATAMQKKWCDANGRMQISPIVGDVAVDLGLNADSLTEVSTEMELQNNERKDNTTEA